jgi:membrane protein DedA with SNARE-associated domain
MSTADSLLGCLSFYVLGWALGEARGVAVLTRSARFLGVAPANIDGWMIDVRGRKWLLTFGSQLIPTVRLMAPGIAGLLRVKPRAFLGATTLGLTVWNTLFIGAGYAAARTAGSPNASTLALKTLVVLLIGAGIATAAWHIIVRRRRRCHRHAPPLIHYALAIREERGSAHQSAVIVAASSSHSRIRGGQIRRPSHISM